MTEREKIYLEIADARGKDFLYRVETGKLKMSRKPMMISEAIKRMRQREEIENSQAIESYN